MRNHQTFVYASEVPALLAAQLVQGKGKVGEEGKRSCHFNQIHLCQTCVGKDLKRQLCGSTR